MRTKKAASEDVAPMRPTLSPEVRENQMISLAMDLVEKRLREGTASSAETTHFLKLATVKSELEKKKLEAENHDRGFSRGLVEEQLVHAGGSGC